MGLLDWLTKPKDPALVAAREQAQRRQDHVIDSLRVHRVPDHIRERLEASRKGTAPWLATLKPAELLIARSHGIRPIAAVSATCWMHYGYSWTEGHAQGWESALNRLRAEARAAGANAVLDVKMHTLPLYVENSMDFSLTGTAVRVDGMEASLEPVIATVPALEFVKLLEAGVVPTGIAIGAHFEWLNNYSGRATISSWAGNQENTSLTMLWHRVRQSAHRHLVESAVKQGNGVLAHVNFRQIFEVEQNDTKRYLARYIVAATTIEEARTKKPGIEAMSPKDLKHRTLVSQHHGAPIPFDISMMVDMHAGKSPLALRSSHHRAYQAVDEDQADDDDDDSNEDGAI